MTQSLLTAKDVADVRQHGYRPCTAPPEEWFFCAVCWRVSCWCCGHAGEGRFDDALCDECSVVLVMEAGFELEWTDCEQCGTPWSSPDGNCDCDWWPERMELGCS